MGYNFTTQVRRCLQAAREQAFRLKHDEVASIHLLLGVLQNPGAKCTEALLNIRVEPHELYKVAETAVPPPLADPVGGPDFPYTEAAKRVLEQSMAEARGLRHGYVAPEHLLLGVLSRGGDLEKLLLGEGLTYASFRAAVAKAGPSEDGMALAESSSSLHASPRAMKWTLLFWMAAQSVGWIALVVAVIALIVAIRAHH
jgi:ATP-dependent Clp protease ATP-binding subunit ClpC